MTRRRIDRQHDFLVATDKLKSVPRRTRPIGSSRRENSAEHSWQVALASLLFAEHANAGIDLLRVLKMLLIHDIPEVEVGDVFHYDKEHIDGLHARETAAAERLFGVLPDDQRDELLSLWREFEARETPDARFAAAIDRLMAFIMNSHNHGGTWTEHGLSSSQVLDKNRHIADGADAIWQLVRDIVADAQSRGLLTGAG